MKRVIICFCLFLSFLLMQHGFSQEVNCVIVDTSSYSPDQPLPQLVNTTMPIVMIYVDFADSRKPDGTLPTVDADTNFFRGDSINAVAGMGWVKVNPEVPNSPLRKKIRKYVYEDYWNMIFSDSIYYDDSTANIHPHPDWSSHNNLLSHGMRVYGSMRDYYREVSYGNFIVSPAQTRSGSSDKYHTGIVNRIDTANGKKYVRWIRLSLNKSAYAYPGSPLIRHALDSIVARHQRGPNEPEYIEFDTTGFRGRFAIVGAGGFIGGWAYLGGTYAGGEKNNQNNNPTGVFGGIQGHVHEFGHNIGLQHKVRGSFDPMHCGGGPFEFCPPHFNPLTKLRFGWLSSNDIVRIRSNTAALSLQPSHLPPTSGHPAAALVTIYGDAGRDSNYYNHSEYFLVEYRTRNGFNRFSGGVSLPGSSPFVGGAIVWHFSSITDYDYNPGCGGGMDLDLSLKIPGYHPEYLGDQRAQDYLTPLGGGGRISLETNTNPNSHSVANLITGISLNGFAFSGNSISFNVNYQLGEPPTYEMFLYGGIEADTLRGRVYLQNNPQSVNVVVPGTTLEFAEGASINSHDIQAVGVPSSQILFRGVGYNNHRMKWNGIQLNSLNATTFPHIQDCRIEDALNGVSISYAGPYPTPMLRSCSFINCNNDIAIAGGSGTEALELSGLDSNTFVSMSVNGNVKLEFSDFSIPNGSTLFVFSDLRPNRPPTRFSLNNRTFTLGGTIDLARANVEFEGGFWRFYSDLNIPLNKSLTINANTALSFASSANIFVDGTLLANGTSSNPVLFTGISGQWGSITSGLVPSTITLNYCNISDAGTAISVNNGTTLTVDHSNFSFTDICVNIFSGSQEQNAAMQITNNSCAQIYTAAVALNGCSNVLIADNHFNGNDGIAGISLSGSSPQVLRNCISGFSYGVYCANGSAPMLQSADDGGHNILSGNSFGVYCEGSDAVLGTIDNGFGGVNSFVANSTFDAGIYKNSKVFAIADYWTGVNPATTIEVDETSWIDYSHWLDTDPNSCGAMFVRGGSDEKGARNDPRDPIPPQVLQALRERRRGNFAQADALLRAIVVNPAMAQGVKQWALGQLLAVGQRMRSTNLPSYFNSLIRSQPGLARKAKALLPLGHLHDGSFGQAVAAYDANIREYPNSELARFGLYGKFLYELYNRRTVSQAQALLNQLRAAYAQSAEAKIAAVQLRNFHSSTIPTSASGGGSQKALSTTGTLSIRQLPTEFELAQNYPNPFNPSTTISFALPKDSHVSLKLYDLLGREVQSLVDESLTAGYHQVTLDASSLATGVYLYRMAAERFVASRKLLLVK